MFKTTKILHRKLKHETILTLLNKKNVVEIMLALSKYYADTPRTIRTDKRSMTLRYATSLTLDPAVLEVVMQALAMKEFKAKIGNQ